MEFLLTKPTTRISRQLVRLFSLLVGRILRLFIVQATVSCKCFSEVAKKGRPKERRRRCVRQRHQQCSVGGPRLGALPYTSGASEVPRLIQAALCDSTAGHCCAITDGAIPFHVVVQTLGAPLPLLDLHGGCTSSLMAASHYECRIWDVAARLGRSLHAQRMGHFYLLMEQHTKRIDEC